MLRYDRNDRRPPNYLARGEQWRVLRLILALGLVVLLIDQVRKPRAAEILGIFFGAREQAGQRAQLNGAQDVADPGHVTGRPADIAVANAGSSGEPGTGGLHAALTAPLIDGLDRVRDNAPFRRAETRPWDQLLGVLDGATPQQLHVASLGERTALQLKEQPDVYRGRLVTVHGTARQSVALEEYHRVVLQQKGAAVPIIVFTLSMPEDFPVGESLREHVSVTGYFFKNWLYAADKELTIAPTLLAKQIDWHRAAAVEAPPVEADSRDVVITIAVAAILSMIITCWLWRRGYRTRRQASGERMAAGRPLDFSTVPMSTPRGAQQ